MAISILKTLHDMKRARAKRTATERTSVQSATAKRTVFDPDTTPCSYRTGKKMASDHRGELAGIIGYEATQDAAAKGLTFEEALAASIHAKKAATGTSILSRFADKLKLSGSRR